MHVSVPNGVSMVIEPRSRLLWGGILNLAAQAALTFLLLTGRLDTWCVAFTPDGMSTWFKMKNGVIAISIVLAVGLSLDVFLHLRKSSKTK